MFWRCQIYLMKWKYQDEMSFKYIDKRPSPHWVMARQWFNGPLTRYVELRVAHALRMPGTYSPPPASTKTASKRSLHASRHVCHARTLVHVEIANSRWQRKRFRHCLRMRNPQFFESDKRPMFQICFVLDSSNLNIYKKNKQKQCESNEILFVRIRRSWFLFILKLGVVPILI